MCRHFNAAGMSSCAGASEAAGHLQPNGLEGSAPSDSVLYSPKPSKPYRRDPTGKAGPTMADLPAGLATPQTPRSVSRLAGVSPGGGAGAGPWPGARSPSVPIMALLQVTPQTLHTPPYNLHTPCTAPLACPQACPLPTHSTPPLSPSSAPTHAHTPCTNPAYPVLS